MYIRAAASIAIFTLAGCSDLPDRSRTAGIANPKTEMGGAQKAGQISNARIVVIDSPDDTQTIETALEELRAAEQGLTISRDPIVQTVLPDGTVLVDLGNRFVRPLFATIDCDGNVNSSHNGTDAAAGGSCQSQRGKNQ